MKRKTALLTIPLTLALLAGCAATVPSNSAQLTYETAPLGATLYENGQSIGMAPVTRTYQGDGKSTQITTPEVTAVWPSGAKTGFYTVLDVGSDRAATLERPSQAPNLQIDLDHAAKVAAARGQETQRAKDALMREQKRDSARCQKQMQSGNVATNDC